MSTDIRPGAVLQPPSRPSPAPHARAAHQAEVVHLRPTWRSVLGPVATGLVVRR